MSRPRAKLPDDEIAYRGRQGEGAPAILAALRMAGHRVAESTISLRLAELRAAGWPGADAFAAALRAGKGASRPTKPKPTTAGTADPARVSARQLDAGGEEELTEEELERLPAELLATASRETARALRQALKAGEVVSVDKLATVLERFSRRLVEVRPPEKIEPVKDPTNLAARRTILARWEALREPYEVALPVVEAIEAHAARLRERVAGAPVHP